MIYCMTLLEHLCSHHLVYDILYDIARAPVFSPLGLWFIVWHCQSTSVLTTWSMIYCMTLLEHQGSHHLVYDILYDIARAPVFSQLGLWYIVWHCQRASVLTTWSMIYCMTLPEHQCSHNLVYDILYDIARAPVFSPLGLWYIVWHC